MTLDAKTRTKLARLAAREQKAREAHYAAAEELRAAIVDASASAPLREVAEAAGRSFQRVHQIARGERGRDRRPAE